jgi:hypothetical protein
MSIRTNPVYIVIVGKFKSNFKFPTISFGISTFMLNQNIGKYIVGTFLNNLKNNTIINNVK